MDVETLKRKGPIYGAIALGVLHIFLAMKMSVVWRKKLIDNKNDESELQRIRESEKYQIAQRNQLNIAEYSGLILPLLIYIQYELNTRNIKLDKKGLVFVMMVVIGSYLFSIGFSSAKKQTDLIPTKSIGALSRYAGIIGLLTTSYKLAKNGSV